MMTFRPKHGVVVSQLLALALTTFVCYFFGNTNPLGRFYDLHGLVMFPFPSRECHDLFIFIFGVNVRCCSSLGLREGALLVS